MPCPARGGRIKCEYFRPAKRGENMSRCEYAEKPLKLILDCPIGNGFKVNRVRRY
jgi:hypothetical protein